MRKVINGIFNYSDSNIIITKRLQKCEQIKNGHHIFSEMVSEPIILD